jgi:site-specific DNA recombinase
MVKHPIRAALYLRISSDRAGDELGIERQRQDCEKLVESRGWEVVETFVDNDVSAYSGKPRPAYTKLLEAVSAGDVKAVVAWHPDRLHRSPKELEVFIDLIEASRVKVATVTAGDYDLETASGRMGARIVGAVARNESEQKSERMRRQRQQAALAGKPHGGSRAFGYDAQGRTIVKGEATVVREAAKRLLAGEPLQVIARDFNARRLYTATGREWTAQTLRQVMMAPRLAGLRVHRGEVVGKGDWPAILTEQQHTRLLTMFASRQRPGRPPVSLLGGLVFCGDCGSKMWQSASRSDYRRYGCQRAPGRGGCGGVSIRADSTEDIVVEVVLARLDTPQLAAEVESVQDDAVADQITDLEARMAELADVYGARRITVTEWMRAREPLEEQLQRARRSRDEASGLLALADFREPGVLRNAWPKLSTDEKRTILGAVIGRVVIALAEKRARFDPDRISIDWRA